MAGLLGGLLNGASLGGGTRLGGSGNGLLGLIRGSSLVLAVLGDELDQVLNGAGARVLNGLVLGTSSVKLDGGEALDLIGNVVEGSINLGDDNLVLELGVGIEGSKLIVLGSESLAVTAPGSVELNEDILGVVKNNVVVALGDDDGDGALLGLGDGLRLDGRLDLAANEVVNELLDGLDGNLLLLVEGELLVLGSLLDGESRELVGLEVQVAGVSTESLGVNGSEVDNTTLGLSNGLEGLAKLLALLGGLGEDVGKGNASGHVSSIGIRANLTDEGGGGGLGELLDGLGVELLSEDGLALVEVLVENDGRGGDTLSLGESDIAAGTKGVLVAELIGDLGEGLVGGLVGGIEVSDNDDLVGLLELLNVVLGEDRDRGKGLLDHVGGDGTGLALTLVGGDGVEATEDLEGRVTLNAMLLAQLGLLSAVDLGELDVLLLEGGGSLLVLGGKGLAVTAPRGEDWRTIMLARATLHDKLQSKGAYTQQEQCRWS